jgi:hypothetical protein
MKTEKVIVTAEYTIRYASTEARLDALRALRDLPIAIGGCGPSGVYGVKRGRFVGWHEIPYAEPA